MRCPNCNGFSTHPHTHGCPEQPTTKFDDLDKVQACAAMLPEPGPEVVQDLITRLRAVEQELTEAKGALVGVAPWVRVLAVVLASDWLPDDFRKGLEEHLLDTVKDPGQLGWMDVVAAAEAEAGKAGTEPLIVRTTL